MKIQFHVAIVVLALASACSRKSDDELARIEGQLTEARCYFTTGAMGGAHDFCSFMSMKANLPVGLVTDDERFVYLAGSSMDLAELANRRLRVQGHEP